MRVRPRSPAVWIAVWATAVLAPVAAGQDTIPPVPTFTLAGRIVDALNERPIISAVVKVPELRRYVFSDVNGRFSFAGFPEGTWEIVVEMLGYQTLDGPVTVSEGNGLLLRLNPDPVALEGLEVRTRSAALLDRRRRRYPFRVTTISPQTIAETINADPAAIFRRNANAFVTSCIDGSGFLTLGACYYRRARKTQVKVFLNEGELVGGMNELSMFPAQDIHSMDWLKDIGELRVYTHWFIERLNTSGTRLAPFKWPIG
ncbi:MAG: carboxypeptidase-like regulatory domain-containing protein [Gemmatimonadota bacterium]|nr:carboxypeptidase-like regulatory domain-containing protein [Gemmatimonadota bacterium]